MRRILVSVLLMTAPASFAAPADDGADPARASFVHGITDFSHKQFRRALAEFEESYRLSPVAEVLYNIAMAHRALGENAEALRALERFEGAATARPAGMNPARKHETDQMIAELRRTVPRKVAVEADRHADPIVPPPVVVPVAPPVVVPVAPPPAPVVMAPIVVPSAPVEAAPVDRPQRSRSPQRGAAISLATIGAASFVGAAATGGLALDKRDQYRDGCKVASTCNQSLYTSGHTLAVTTDALIGVGAVTAVASILLFAIHPRPHRVTVAPTLRGLQIAGSF